MTETITLDEVAAALYANNLGVWSRAGSVKPIYRSDAAAVVRAIAPHVEAAIGWIEGELPVGAEVERLRELNPHLWALAGLFAEARAEGGS